MIHRSFVCCRLLCKRQTALRMTTHSHAPKRCHPEERSLSLGERLPTKDLCIFRLILMADVPGFTQVFPLRIHRYDQGNLLDPQQAFDLLLAGDRSVNVTKAFEIDQAVDLVARCELAFYSLLVLEHSAFEVARYAGVEGLGAVGHDVDVVEVGRGIHRSFTSLEFLLCRNASSVQDDRGFQKVYVTDEHSAATDARVYYRHLFLC